MAHFPVVVIFLIFRRCNNFYMCPIHSSYCARKSGNVSKVFGNNRNLFSCWPFDETLEMSFNNLCNIVDRSPNRRYGSIEKHWNFAMRTLISQIPQRDVQHFVHRHWLYWTMWKNCGIRKLLGVAKHNQRFKRWAGHAKMAFKIRIRKLWYDSAHKPNEIMKYWNI